MINHSRSSMYLRLYGAIIVLAAVLFLGSAQVLQAQMFSMDERERPQFNRPTNEFYLGFEPTTVTYQGEEEGAGEFAYDAPVIRAGYSRQALNLYLGAGGEITGSEDVAYFDVGGNFNYGLPLYFTEKFILLLPVRISSRLTNITTDRTTMDRFRFGSATIGAGLQANVRPNPNLRIQLGAVPSYGFTFASGGLFGGALGLVAAEGRLFFDNIFGDTGLSLGYKYDFRNYNVEEERYDYQIQGHSIQLGITF